MADVSRGDFHESSVRLFIIGENRWDIVGSERGGTANGIIGAEIGAELGAKRIVDERIEPRKLAHNLAYLHWPMGIKPLTLCPAVSTRLLGRRKGRGRREENTSDDFFFFSPSFFSLFIAVVDSFVFLREKIESGFYLFFIIIFLHFYVIFIRAKGWLIYS